MTSTPLGAVKQYIDGFNNGDAEVMAATFDAQGSILDGMAPHLWVGPTAAEDWYRDALAEGEHLGVSDYLITLAEPSHNESPTITRIWLYRRLLRTTSAARQLNRRERASRWHFTSSPKAGG